MEQYVALDVSLKEISVCVIDGKGAVGYTRGTASVELQELSPNETLMQYSSDVQVGGRIAAVGQRLLESVGKMMMKQALEALERELNARLQSGPGDGGRGV